MSRLEIQGQNLLPIFILVFVFSCSDNPSRPPPVNGSSQLPYSQESQGAGSESGGTENESESESQTERESEAGAGADSKPVVTLPNPSPNLPSPSQTPTPIPPGEAGDPLCYKGDAFACAIEQIIVAETNKLRSNGALLQSAESSFVVRLWSKTQADVGSISHDGFPAERKKVLKAEFPNANWSFFAENVAMLQSGGSDASKIAQQFVEMWWKSPGHKANMIGNYKKIGVGVSKKGNSYYATQIFH